jgi:uncharacterized coiled-coil DUF342 family protein
MYSINQIFTNDDDYTNKANWCNENGYYIAEIEPLEDGTRQFQIKAPQEPSQEELVRQRINEIKVKVQNVLDAKAQELEYDDGFTLATYATSTKERYRNQAIQFIAWRDNVWDKCYEILNAFQSGEIEMPTIEYVLERLPSLNWDDTSE